MEIRFPRYTRAENLACKLLDDDILDIQERHKNGESHASIARDYKVTPQAIYYWLLTPEQKRRNLEMAYERERNREPRIDFNYDAYRERKKKLHPEIKEYELKTALNYKKYNPNAKEVKKRSDKKYTEKNREIIYKKNLEYRKKHREYLRQMAEWYRGQRKIKPTFQ